MEASPNEITQLLHAHRAGDHQALARVFPLVYEQLRELARSRVGRERPGHTLQPTELVHEAFLKLDPERPLDWQDRVHFLAVASRAMRQVLADHATRRRTAKRGGGAVSVTLDDAIASAEPPEVLGELGRALARLEAIDARQARVVDCRFFGGLSISDTALALGVSEATVSRDWAFARAWLHRELDGDADGIGEG